MTPSWIAGVDGFRRGWFAVLVNHAQGRVIETRHPELSLYHLAGRAMQHNKKTPEGREERLRVLSKTFPDLRKEVFSGERRVPYDDMIDAYAAAWTAMRIENGIAKCFPKNPPVDSKKLRMEIWS